MQRHRIPLLILLLLAFTLRVWGLADHNIWWDEGVGAWLARLPVGAILHWTGHDVHPPLYYLLLRGWWLLVGDGAFILRFPSALLGTLGVAVIYGLGRALGGRRAGLVSAFLLTLSRFAIFWSQEIRMYALAALLTTGALWAAIRMWQGERWQAWMAYVLTGAGSLLSLYLAAPVLFITNLAFPLIWLRSDRPRRFLFRWATAQLAVLALVAPWLIYALPRMHSWSSDAAFSPGFFVHLYATMLAVGVPVDIEIYTPLTAAVFLVLIGGLVALWRRRRTPAQTAGAAMLALGLLLPALVVYVVSAPWLGFYYARPLVPRYLLPLAACFYVLLGWGLAALSRWRHWAGATGVALTAAVALAGLVSFYPGRTRRDEFTSLAATIEAHRQPGDEVILHTDVGWPVFAAHYAGDWHPVPYGASIDAAFAASRVEPVWQGAQGVWLVTTPDAQRADPQQVIRGWLDERATAVAEWDFGENGLTLYARTAGRAGILYDVGPDFEAPEGPGATFASGATLQGAWVPLPRYGTGDTVHLVLVWEEPPQGAVTVEMVGMGQTVEVSEPPPATRTLPVRQLVDLPLTPDLPGGSYRLRVWVAGGGPVTVGAFTLVPRRVAGASSAAEIPAPLNLRLGESIELLGYDLPRTTVAPGEVLDLTLYWQATEAVEDRTKVFVHLLGETYNARTQNFIWGQQDNEPVAGQAPTTVWTPGVVVEDPYHITVAADAPPGRYQLEIGMYGLVGGDRLPVFDGDGRPQGDAIILAEIEVEAP
ncbi:MAG: glycosyltransferase family 39 protein [Anaerolineae bacterium]